MREIVEREAFGISPWRRSISWASVQCTWPTLGQRRLCLLEKGLGDVALFGERYNPWRHAGGEVEVRGLT